MLSDERLIMARSKWMKPYYPFPDLVKFHEIETHKIATHVKGSHTTIYNVQYKKNHIINAKKYSAIIMIARFHD